MKKNKSWTTSYFTDDHDRILRVSISKTGTVRVNVLVQTRDDFTWWVYEKSEAPKPQPLTETSGYNFLRDVARRARCPLFQRKISRT